MKKRIVLLVMSCLLAGAVMAFAGCDLFEKEETTSEVSETPADSVTLEPSEGLAFTSNGDGTCYVSGLGDCTDTDVMIPSVSPDGEPVTGIGEKAFFGCTELTSITIPDSVESIGKTAFGGCTGLTRVTIPDSVTSIGDGAFNSCSGLTSITIPDSVESIGKNAFYGCSGLTSITIPDSVTCINVGTFFQCTGLMNITIPKSVTSIGSDAFVGCTGLTSIGDSAFG